MIERIAAYKSSDGTAHSSLEEAQKHELFEITIQALNKAALTSNDEQNRRFAAALFEYSDRIVDALTTTATSKPRARRVNGGTKKRKPAVLSVSPAAAA